jgi:hypothetical protein
MSLSIDAVDHTVLNVADLERPADADTVTWFTGVAPVPGSADLCFVTKLSPDAAKANWGRAEHRDRSGPDGAIRRTRADDLGVLPRSGW